MPAGRIQEVRYAGTARDVLARWALVVPVKRLAVAKTRLAEMAGPRRPDLALAFALDTVTAALACPAVELVVVVTDEEEAGRRLGAAGALVVGDEPDAGLNPALRHGAARAARGRPELGVAALSADLPALRPEELRHALVAASAHELAVLADADGSGTTLLAASHPRRFQPAFGPGSLARHRAAGAADLAGPLGASVASVRRDVDTADDLQRALALGVGAHTIAVLTQLPPQLLGQLPAQPAQVARPA